MSEVAAHTQSGALLAFHKCAVQRDGRREDCLAISAWHFDVRPLVSASVFLGKVRFKTVAGSVAAIAVDSRVRPDSG
jgi:hypothetical protein